MIFNRKTIQIYEALYSDKETTKENLTKILNVSSIKTVESYIKDIEDIFYDIDIRQYRFKELLPKYITIGALNKIISNSVVNKLLRNDFGLITNNTSFSMNEMIDTSDLSGLCKKIIMFSSAIKYNCVLKIDYKGLSSKPLEEKYVEPHSYFTNGFTYYSYISYNKRNAEHIGEERTLAFNSIGNIEAIEYIKDGEFKRDTTGNAYGSFKKDKYVLLNIENEAASFFKRELIFNNDAFELMDEELDGVSITVKMYYNHINEIIKLIKQWMPQISIFGNVELKNKVYQKVKEDLNTLLEES